MTAGNQRIRGRVRFAAPTKTVTLRIEMCGGCGVAVSLLS